MNPDEWERLHRIAKGHIGDRHARQARQLGVVAAVLALVLIAGATLALIAGQSWLTVACILPAIILAVSAYALLVTR